MMFAIMSTSLDTIPICDKKRTDYHSHQGLTSFIKTKTAAHLLAKIATVVDFYKRKHPTLSLQAFWESSK